MKHLRWFRKRPARKQSRTLWRTGRVILKGSDMTDLRHTVYRLAEGRCEELNADGKRCNKLAPWDVRSTGNSPTLCTAPTAGVTPQKIAAGTATGVTAASIPAHNDRLNEQELMRLTASRARFQTVSERVEQLFSTRRWVTSGELAEITGTTTSPTP